MAKSARAESARVSLCNLPRATQTLTPNTTSTPLAIAMVRNTGTTNYTMADIDRLIGLVLKTLPLGKDEWERLAVSFNAIRPRGAPERDFESLRRKFKVLYSTRKPTGVATMPPHIQKAKEAKQAIDDRANVIELDDEADEDQRAIEPDFSFEMEPDATFNEPDDPAMLHDSLDDGSAASSRGLFQELLTSPLVTEDSDGAALTPRPTPTTRRPGQGGLQPPRKTPTSGDTAAQPRPEDGRAGRSRDEIETAKYPELNSHSNRFGGADLVALRDSTSAKRAREEDSDTLEASHAKAKRIRAMKKTAALKTKMDGLESAAGNLRSSILETLLLLREENERKAEERRTEEEQRRREENSAREALRLAEKAEAEERRRSERLEMEDRARRDREEARARTQELVMLIGVLTKKD